MDAATLSRARAASTRRLSAYHHRLRSLERFELDERGELAPRAERANERRHVQSLRRERLVPPFATATRVRGETGKPVQTQRRRRRGRVRHLHHTHTPSARRFFILLYHLDRCFGVVGAVFGAVCHEVVSQQRARRESGQANEEQLPALLARRRGRVLGRLLRELAVNLYAGDNTTTKTKTTSSSSSFSSRACHINCGAL
jgi:hypothetical protein